MKYYVGKTFEEAGNKEYKSLPYAKSKADGTGSYVFDEAGTKVYPLKVQLTDEIPDGALEENEDGSMKAYDEDGNIVGSMTKEELEQIEKGITEDDIKAALKDAYGTDEHEEEVSGKIQRVCKELLHLRRRPSYDNDAICGITEFDERRVLKKVINKDGIWYQTEESLWVSGDPKYTQFIQDQE